MRIPTRAKQKKATYKYNKGVLICGYIDRALDLCFIIFIALHALQILPVNLCIFSNKLLISLNLTRSTIHNY